MNTFTLILLTILSSFSFASEEAIFAGGCFWCMEKPFDEVSGVISTTPGYTGGRKINPSYEEVSAGDSGHYEVMKIVYDPKIVSYRELLSVFWKNVDPYDGKGQFCDKGEQYLSAVFYQDEKQKEEALKSKSALKKPDSVKSRILKASPFYPAEENHQNFYLKNSLKYKFYRLSCGRDKRLKELWGK